MPHGFSQRSMSKRSCHKEVKTSVAAGRAALMASSLIIYSGHNLGTNVGGQERFMLCRQPGGSRTVSICIEA